ncbi:ATP adenylyltransferase [Metschnikowia bicuspidata var. bicuspidata NRRL YB-4993]|uniref:ATP adenylyltransferase n=1 Tax=Metschnikowia bicuspidata var. bicuspidata NRRL YB-4993 TaxID=869754 RepID=A0A1A0HE02_9ASCO|nr:ATP adenylyltransferase [Metschnikowia bicuspidata var. bicuspidata NRRL YB-4993]OBA22210.1 ATP adenylyltransferase [Metschnikowia bicuspidata var. bicuspidata NRRL YB-4993]
MQSLPLDFHNNLWIKYVAALRNGDLSFTGDSASCELVNRELNGSNYNFHLTVLKSLENRPEKGDIGCNPFENPEPELTILNTFGENNEFRIVLNKFPVVPAHFMLLTKIFKSQDTPLSPNELLATYSVLSGLSRDGTKEDWFAFYNCGPESGASQPHKHVQFMTLPAKHRSFAEKLIDSSEDFIPSQTKVPLQDKNLPFAHFVAKLPDNVFSESGDVLLMTFYSLLQSTLNVLKDHDCHHISFNFCATMKYMMLIPRSTSNFEGIGINSCGFMGLALCKNPNIAKVFKEKGFENVLSVVAFPNTFDLKTDEYHY